MTKREKELQKLRNQMSRLGAQREAAIKTLVKTETQMPKVAKQIARLSERLLKRKVNLRVTMDKEVAQALEPEPKVVGDGLPDKVPEFLRRGQAAQKAVDGIISEESKRLAALPDPKTKEKKAEQREIEKENRHAELTGQKRKWPKTGRDALR